MRIAGLGTTGLGLTQWHVNVTVDRIFNLRRAGKTDAEIYIILRSEDHGTGIIGGPDEDVIYAAFRAADNTSRATPSSGKTLFIGGAVVVGLIGLVWLFGRQR